MIKKWVNEYPPQKKRNGKKIVFYQVMSSLFWNIVSCHQQGPRNMGEIYVNTIVKPENYEMIIKQDLLII